MMHGDGKSDTSVVPMKLPNKAGEPAAEAVEEREVAKGNSAEFTHSGHSAGGLCAQSLDRVRSAQGLRSYLASVAITRGRSRMR